jgi:signal peptidase
MQWLEIIIGILLSVLSGLIFSALIVSVFYMAYKVEVKKSSFDLHFRILKRIGQRLDGVFHENRIAARLDRYSKLVERPSFFGIIIPLLLVLIIGFVLYNQMIFFAVVGSGSMEPTFKKGDLILMQNIDVEVENGNIIMFDTPTVLIPVTHRVIEISDKGFITKGDARSSKDGWIVKDEDIVGKAVTINENPILIKDVGLYFIEDFEAATVTKQYNEEFLLMRKIISSIKSFGLVIFYCAILMYILTSIRS